MHRFGAKLLAVILVMFVMVGCGPRLQSIYNVQNHPLPRGAATLSQAQLDQIAQDAAVARGWLTEKTAPGQFRITQKWRTHSAESKLSIAASGYSIMLMSSSNLREGNGVIHRTYNSHVSTLETDIERRLLNATN